MKKKPTQRHRDNRGRFIASGKKVTKAKNPAKVAAGKKRFSAAIRDEKGRYISAVLSNEIKKTVLATKKIDVSKIPSDQTGKINQLLKEAKVTPAQVKKFYEQNQDIFEDIVKRGEIKGTSKNSNQIEKAIREYKGKIFINDGTGPKEVSKEKAIFEITRFKSFLSDNINVVDFTVMPKLSLDGKLNLNIPNAKNLLKQVREYLGAKNNDELADFTGPEIMEALNDILSGIYDDEQDLIIYAS